MSNVNKKAFAKKALAGAVLLATSPAWVKTASGGDAVGKSQLGVNHLALDIVPGRNVAFCASHENIATKTGSDATPNEFSVAINPLKTNTVPIKFYVSTIWPSSQDYYIALIYSPTLLLSPAIMTNKSRNDFLLDLHSLEILALYTVAGTPPGNSLALNPPTHIGRIAPPVGSDFDFLLNLDTSILENITEDNVYIQAVLIPKADFDAQKYSQAIMSEVNTLHFVEECPPNTISAAKDGDGTLTVTDQQGDVLKTRVTASAEANATVTFGAGKGGG